MATATWRNLEQRVAAYFQKHGYAARTNQVLRAPNGQPHEIDVLAEKQDAAGTHRVVVECKAWRSAVDKDVVYKLHQEMADLGFTKGIIVAPGGFRSGARAAAEQRHIELWGPDEITHKLGDEAFAGLPLGTPDAALGVPVEVTLPAAMQEIRKARGGFAGIGAEEVASVGLVWVPAVELQLAITRLRPGLISDKEELIRQWVLFETLTGRLIGARDEPRSFAHVALDSAVVRPQKSSAQIVADMGKILAKHRRAKTDAAERARQSAHNAVGLPGSVLAFALEAEKDVFVPMYIGTLRRKATERLVAIHAGNGNRVTSVEQALHEKITLLSEALRERAAKASAPGPAPDASIPAGPPSERMCTCGAPMVVRRRRSDGEPCWGCSTFPRCRQTAPA